MVEYATFFKIAFHFHRLLIAAEHSPKLPIRDELHDIVPCTAFFLDRETVLLVLKGRRHLETTREKDRRTGVSHSKGLDAE